MQEINIQHILKQEFDYKFSIVFEKQMYRNKGAILPAIFDNIHELNKKDVIDIINSKQYNSK